MERETYIVNREWETGSGGTGGIDSSIMGAEIYMLITDACCGNKEMYYLQSRIETSGWIRLLQGFTWICKVGLSHGMVLGIEDEFNGVTDASSDVGRAER